MTELGHKNMDALKMNLEGPEYGVIESLCAGGTISKVSQLLVDFHHRMEGFRIAWVSEVGHEVLFVRG